MQSAQLDKHLLKSIKGNKRLKLSATTNRWLCWKFIGDTKYGIFLRLLILGSCFLVMKVFAIHKGLV